MSEFLWAGGSGRMEQKKGLLSSPAALWLVGVVEKNSDKIEIKKYVFG